MQISINLPFEELLAIIKNLNPKEKIEVAQILMNEVEISDQKWQEAVPRKEDFEAGKIETESCDHLKSRLLN